MRFLERYKSEHSLNTNGSVVERTLQALQDQELEEAYAAAAQEARDKGEADVWDGTAGDGLSAGEWE